MNMAPDAYVDMILDNYSASGNTSVLKDVVFGPESENLEILISVSSKNGSLTVTVGNGPDIDQVPGIIPPILQEVAQLLAEAEWED